MRFLLKWAVVGLCGAAAATAQDISFGLKGGVPFADSLKVADRSWYSSDKASWVLGPAFEMHLLGGLGVEADLLCRRVQYWESSPATGSPIARTTGQFWEVPLLLRYHSPEALVRPTLAGGLSYRRLARVKLHTSAGSGGEPAEVAGRNSIGATLGGGIEVGGGLVRLSAEIRYTRWGSSNIRTAVRGLATQLNQADFLLGIMF